MFREGGQGGDRGALRDDGIGIRASRPSVVPQRVKTFGDTDPIVPTLNIGSRPFTHFFTLFNILLACLCKSITQSPFCRLEISYSHRSWSLTVLTFVCLGCTLSTS